MSVADVVYAAEALGVMPRRVRQMLADGVLKGEYLGRVWVVDRDSLDRAIQRRPSVGRPWRDRSAWAVLGLANGDQLDLSAVDRSRARQRLAAGLENLLPGLASRAEIVRFYAHPGVLGPLAQDPAFVRSGVSAAADYAADLYAGDFVEGYVASSRLANVIDRFALDGEAERPNVLLRVVDDEVWPFEVDASMAPLPVVAVDLLEAEDERSRRAGHALLRRK